MIKQTSNRFDSHHDSHEAPAITPPHQTEEPSAPMFPRWYKVILVLCAIPIVLGLFNTVTGLWVPARNADGKTARQVGLETRALQRRAAQQARYREPRQCASLPDGWRCTDKPEE